MKKVAFIVLGLAALAAVAGGFALFWQSDSSPVAHSVSNAVLPNVTQADLDGAGIYTVTTAEGLQASVASTNAESMAVNREGTDAKVLSSQLVQLSNAQYHNRLAWAISLDPLTSNIIAPSGPPACRYVLDGAASFVLVLVDAITGNWLMRLQAVHVKAMGSPTDGTVCYRSPTPTPTAG